MVPDKVIVVDNSFTDICVFLVRPLISGLEVFTDSDLESSAAAVLLMQDVLSEKSSLWTSAF